jgi:hypothetical protein
MTTGVPSECSPIAGQTTIRALERMSVSVLSSGYRDPVKRHGGSKQGNRVKEEKGLWDEFYSCVIAGHPGLAMLDATKSRVAGPSPTGIRISG